MSFSPRMCRELSFVTPEWVVGSSLSPPKFFFPIGQVFSHFWTPNVGDCRILEVIFLLWGLWGLWWGVFFCCFFDFSTLFRNFFDLKFFSRRFLLIFDPQKKFQLDRPRIFPLLGPNKVKIWRDRRDRHILGPCFWPCLADNGRFTNFFFSKITQHAHKML